MSPITLVIEVVLALMLGACLYYFWRLDQKLQALRTGQDGALRAAAELGQATAQAEAAVRAMRATAQRAQPPIAWVWGLGACARRLMWVRLAAGCDDEEAQKSGRFGAVDAGGDGNRRRRARAQGRRDGRECG